MPPDLRRTETSKASGSQRPPGLKGLQASKASMPQRPIGLQGISVQGLHSLQVIGPGLKGLELAEMVIFKNPSLYPHHNASLFSCLETIICNKKGSGQYLWVQDFPN